MEQFANLGTTAVMDADKLAVGSYIKMDGQLFVVEKIVNDLHVYFSPVTGWKLWMHRWNELRVWVKILVSLLLCFFFVWLYSI